MSTTRLAAHDDAESEHVVGIDLGVRNLLTASLATTDPDLSNALVVDGDPSRRLYAELAERDDAPVEPYAQVLESRFEQAIADLDAFVDEPEEIAVESLAYPEPGPLADAIDDGTDAGAWLMGRMRAHIDAWARRTETTVVEVFPENTSRECHACGAAGARTSDNRFVCPDESCAVEHVHADAGAAASIARRAVQGRRIIGGSE